MSYAEMLAKMSLFSEISPDHLLEIAETVEVRDCAAGEVIFREGEPAVRLYGVADGEVELALSVKDSILKTEILYEEYTRRQTEMIEREIIVDLVGAGEIFGWSALTLSSGYTSKAVCVQPATIMALPAESLRSFFHNNPQVGYPFMERLTDVVSRRLANRTDKLLQGWSEAFSVNRI